jgi:hypothetical protein
VAGQPASTKPDSRTFLNDVRRGLESGAGFPEAHQGRGMKRSRLKRLLRTLTNYRVAMAALVAVVVGTLLLWSETQTQGAVAAFLGGLGATLISVGLIVLVYELWLRRSIVAEFLGAAGLGSDLAATGIREVRPWGTIDWPTFFDECPGDIQIVVGYAASWAGLHAERVVKAAVSNGARITITVLDPDAAGALLEFYGRMYGTDADGLRARIENAMRAWQEAAERSATAGHRVMLRIDGLDRHTPFTFYRAGDCMWVIFSPRQTGRSDDIPAILCRKGARGGRGLHEWVLNDLEACRRDGHARVLWEAP